MDAGSGLEVAERAALERTPESAAALECVLAGVDAARPEPVVASAIEYEDGTLTVDGATYDLDAYERVLVLGGGNAAGGVAAALEARLGDRIDDGVVVTDEPVPLDRLSVVEGTHPYPDRAALEGTERLRALAGEAGERDLIVGIVTGGGSALLPAPAGSITLDALGELTRALLHSGADIAEINAVRKHLSTVKGGRLAATAAPATVLGIVLSDVAGDDPSAIASGPFAPDPTTFAEAAAVLDRYGLSVPPPIRERLDRGVQGSIAETPTAGDAAFAAVDCHLVASNDTAIDAAVERATALGYEPLVLSARIGGEASEVGAVHAAVAEEVRATGRPIEPPAVVVSGGETTVSFDAGEEGGSGGPNQEFALRAGLELEQSGIAVASVDTDGIDGNSDLAGALVTADRFGDEAAARAALDGHDVSGILEDAGAAIRTGPTGTNVNDLRVLVIGEA